MNKLGRIAPLVLEHFKSQNKSVYTITELRKLVHEHGTQWGLGPFTTVPQLINHLVENTHLTKVQLQFPGRKETRYLWGWPSTIEIALTLKPKGYISHLTALYLHDLIDGPLHDVYINHEQPSKPSKQAVLEQQRIDQAFQNKPRVTNYKTTCDGTTFWILNGMNTASAGVIAMRGVDGKIINLTNVERTLLDAAVRPFYAGGVGKVLEAYKRAHSKLTSTSLSQIYQQIGYIYPYHQAIGFYMDKAGVYNDDDLQPLLAFPREFDFYLINQMQSPSYSAKWRIYYPAELD